MKLSSICLQFFLVYFRSRGKNWEGIHRNGRVIKIIFLENFCKNSLEVARSTANRAPDQLGFDASSVVPIPSPINSDEKVKDV